MSGWANVNAVPSARAERTVTAPLTEANLAAHTAQLNAAAASIHHRVNHNPTAGPTYGTSRVSLSISAWLSSTDDPLPAGCLRGDGN
nr:hypothetical protein CFP56_21816 [Quercus suber]